MEGVQGEVTVTFREVQLHNICMGAPVVCAFCGLGKNLVIKSEKNRIRQVGSAKLIPFSKIKIQKKYREPLFSVSPKIIKKSLISSHE